MHYLFAQREKLKDKLKSKYIFLFLDYDGTLAPIVDTPAQAIIPRETRFLLERLAKSPMAKLAIISGRALEDIKNKVGIKDIIYVGNHGLEIESPKIKFESLILLRYKAILKSLKGELNKKLSSIRGVILEDKGLSLSVHYRLVEKKRILEVKTVIYQTALPYLVKNKIKIKTGKLVMEIMPPLERDKGKTVLWLLARQKFALRDKPILPIYIGDDITDEDAFGVLKDKGLTIFVGRPKPSKAEYYLKNTQEVFGFLKDILEIQNS